MRDLLLIAIVVLCSAIALRQPVVGLLSFIGLGFLNPHTMAWSIGRTFPFALLTSMGTIVGFLFWSEPKRFPRQRETFILLALWGMFGVSTAFAIDPESAWEHFIHVTKILLMVFLTTALINTEERLQWLLRVMALALGFYAVKGGIFAFMTGGQYIVFGPGDNFIGARNSLGLALTMNIPLLLYLLKSESHPWMRRIILATLILSYPAVICTYSRGAWLSLAAATVFLILKSKHKLAVTTTVALCGFILIPYLPQLAPQQAVERYDSLINYQEEGSAQSRFWNWEFCQRVGLAHPLTGGGFDFYSPEAYATYFPEFLERWRGKVWSCHSMWYTIFGEHGFPGLALWLGLIGSYFLSVRQIRAYSTMHGGASWMIHCADMLQIALIAYMVGGTFLDVAYFDMFYYLVAVLIIMKERIRLAMGTSSSVLPPLIIRARATAEAPY
jgi:probable O-glycosylation ligase (exosortase A-associated)